ncbi:MAG: PilZ domain-containing protein [Phycisphaerae bacterium]|nr:PilZ domain-containing protein [Phycisphaerae bacterium]
MNLELLERRTDPRTQAYVPVTLRLHDREEDTPAELLDLSCGGAGILTTAYNAPSIGEYLDLRFEVPSSDGGSETDSRLETGIVVNVGTPERGIARVGVRFLQHPRIGSDLFDPNDVLSGYRKSLPLERQGRRWGTERETDGVCPCAHSEMLN